MTEPAWTEVDLEAVQDRLAQALWTSLEDQEDLVTLLATALHDAMVMGDLSPLATLREAREYARDWLEARP